MRIALIAHDRLKDEMVRFANEYREVLNKHHLCGTGTTGRLLREKAGLEVTCYLSGPLGGDQQIGSQVAEGHIDMVIFLRDPLTPQPHEPDITALLRICDVRGIPAATNPVSARLFVESLRCIEPC